MIFNPLDPALDELMDKIVVAGRKSPGLCNVNGGSSPRKWDERNGYGLSGATIVFTGLGVAEFVTRLWLWEDAHFEEWGGWKALVAPPPQGQRPKIVDVYHPLLQEVDILAAGVVDRTQLTPEGETGLWYVEIKWKTYRKPLPQIGAPAGSKTTQYQKTAQDAGDAQIQALLKQLQAAAQ